MTGKLKTKGNMMFATKLDGVLKVRLRSATLYVRSVTQIGRPQRQRRSCRHPVSSTSPCTVYHPYSPSHLPKRAPHRH